MTVIQTWADLLERLDTVLALCRGIGLADHVQRGRFPVYRDHLALLVSRLADGGQSASSAAFDADRSLSVVTLTESTELADLLPFFRTVSNEILHDKLAHVLGGALLPFNEDMNTNQARNILFELNLASKLWKAGLDPKLGGEPDLWLEYEGKRLLIQCKRPSGPRSARQNLKAAQKQLLGDLKTAPRGARGIIAVSLTKLLNQGNEILAYTSESRGRRGLADRLQDTADRVLLEWSDRDPTIIGLVCHVITPGIDQSEPRWMVVQQTNVHPFSVPGSPDDQLLRSLYGELAKIWY